VEIDVKSINEKLLYREGLSDREKEFVRQVMEFQEATYEVMKIEIDCTIKRYAKIEAEKFVELYNKYIKVEAQNG
jgi:hypothetical protein